MSQLQQWRLAITPLSPVHLGTGQDYEPTGYVIDEGALFEFDGIAALQALPGVERERLGKILDGRPTQDMLLQVQSFFHANRERLIAVSRNQVRVNPTVEAFYGERVGKVAQHETGGRKVQNKLEIERTAYNPPTGQAIIPGSALKGAIRTALLDRINDGASACRGSATATEGPTRGCRSACSTIRCASWSATPCAWSGSRMPPWSDPDGFATEVRFAVNRKKQPVMKGDVLLQSQAEQQNLYQLLECLPGMQPRAFSGELSDPGRRRSGEREVARPAVPAPGDRRRLQSLLPPDPRSGTAPASPARLPRRRMGRADAGAAERGRSARPWTRTAPSCCGWAGTAGPSPSP